MGETEEWRPIAGSNGRYDVSDLGRVRSWIIPNSPRLLAEPRILAARPQSDGYAVVQLFINGTMRSRLVHNLVLEAFVGPRPGSILEWDGAHDDDDPTNNHLTNLKWATRKQNMADRKRHGRTRPERSSETRDGVKHYRCTKCMDWKAETEFRLLRVPSSLCGRSSACAVCTRRIDAQKRRDKRAAAKPM